MYYYPKDNKIFSNHSEIRSHFKQMSLPANIRETTLASLGVKNLYDTEKPEHNPIIQIVTENNPVLMDGEWYRSYSVFDRFSDTPGGKTKAEQEAEAIQAEFDRLQAQKQADLTAFAKSHMSAQMSDYSEWEAISWPMLIAEAEQFIADGTVGEYMTAEIGVKYPDAASLATILMTRKEMMKQFRAGVVLVRQQKEAEIEAAETIEALNAINIQEGWPV